MDHADRAVVVRMLHEVPADHVVAVGHALALLRSGRQEHTGVLDTTQREHVAPGIHPKGRPLQRPAREGLDAPAGLIQTDVDEVGEGDDADVLGPFQHGTVDAC